MIAVLAHDTGASGLMNWARDELAGGRIDGLVLDPFHSPGAARDQHRTAAELVDTLREEHPAAQLLLDPMTHAAVLPSTASWDNYDTWEWWPSTRLDLSTPAARREHVEAVFTVQQQLGLPSFAPTVTLDYPHGHSADLALELAVEARRQDPTCVQALVGRRSLWSSGSVLDSHLGRLVALRAPRWAVTVMRENQDFPPDQSDHYAGAGHARTVHSLAQRAEVILCRGGDGAALPALAAGAAAWGTGWFSKQRVCSPGLVGPAGRASNPLYAPHPGLLARLRQDIAEALADRDPQFARAMRHDQDIPTNHAEHRVQHLRALRSIAEHIDAAGTGPRTRVPTVRALLAATDANWQHAVSLGITDIGPRERTKWITDLWAGFEQYAHDETL